MRQIVRFSTTAMLSLLITAGTSAAATTLASSLIVSAPAEALECRITNVGTKPITLGTVPQFFDSSGTLVSAGTDCAPSIPLAPGSSCFSFAGPGSFSAYCAVSFSSSKKAVRGSLSRTDGNRTLFAVPLQ